MTDQIDFQRPTDYPPEILAAPDGPPIGDIINLIKGDWPNGYHFNIRIRDLNVDQDLKAHVRIVKEPGENPDFDTLIVLRGDKAERTVMITVPINVIVPSRCHRLDVAVSGSFDRVTGKSFDGIVAGTGDLAKAMWWIWEGDLDAPGASAAIATSCPREFEIDMPAAAGRGATP